MLMETTAVLRAGAGALWSLLATEKSRHQLGGERRESQFMGHNQTQCRYAALQSVPAEGLERKLIWCLEIIIKHLTQWQYWKNGLRFMCYS